MKPSFGIGTAIAVLIVAVFAFVSYAKSPARTAADMLDLCSNTDVKCLGEQLSHMIVEQQQTGAAFRTLRALYPRLHDQHVTCADVANRVGSIVAYRNPDFTTIRLDPESVFCNYGFYQSYARVLLTNTHDTETARSLCAYVARSMKGSSTGASLECYRGVGNALPFIRSDVQGKPADMSALAIETCEAIAPSPDERNACIAGVFSMIGAAEYAGEYGLSANGDPMQLCRDAGPYRSHCEGNLKRAVVTRAGWQSAKTGLQAVKDRYPTLTSGEIESVAFTLGYNNVLFEGPHLRYADLVGACVSEEGNVQRACESGVVVGIAKNGNPGDQHMQLSEFCDVARSIVGSAMSECPNRQALEYLKGFLSAPVFKRACDVFDVHSGMCDPDPIIADVSACGGDDRECMAGVLGERIVQGDSMGAFRTLRHLYPNLSRENLRCYDLASAIGTYVAHQEPDFLKLSLVPESVYCNYGFYQRYARETVLLRGADTAAAFCEYVAGSMNDVSTGAAEECYRGIGSGAPFVQRDLVGNARAMSTYAIDTCERVALDTAARQACVSGAFNAIGNAVRNKRDGLTVEADDPMQLCRSQRAEHYELCETAFKRSIMDGRSGPVALEHRMAELTAKHVGLHADDKRSIAYTVGYDNAYVSATSPDFEALARLCETNDTDLRERCVHGVSVGLAKNGLPGQQDQQIQDFCAHVPRVLGDFSGSCPGPSALSYLRGFFAPDRFEVICRAFMNDDELCVR